MTRVLVPAPAAARPRSAAAGQVERVPSRLLREIERGVERPGVGSRRLVPHCDAYCPERSYSRAHYCEKTTNLRPIGRGRFCRHHRAQLERRGWLDLGAGVRLEVTR